MIILWVAWVNPIQVLALLVVAMAMNPFCWMHGCSRKPFNEFNNHDTVYPFPFTLVAWWSTMTTTMMRRCCWKHCVTLIPFGYRYWRPIQWILPRKPQQCSKTMDLVGFVSFSSWPKKPLFPLKCACCKNTPVPPGNWPCHSVLVKYTSTTNN